MAGNIPRLLITASKSGSGKTMITCGLLQAVKNRGLKVSAYKCGPDYIDPMFHREVLGISSYNLDTFLCGRKAVREILIKHGGELAVMEGVMGYYDGLAGISTEASAYDVAEATDTPAVMVVDCKGASVSVVPHIQGFLRYKENAARNSHIEGIILNRVSPMMYGRMKTLIEKETSVKVYGYIPVMDDFSLESRYLGLKMPGEIEGIKEKLKRLGRTFEETLDIEGLIQLALSAPDLVGSGELKSLVRESCESSEERKKVRIGVAADEAFCFIYQDNLDILSDLGAEIVTFSPLHDNHLPRDLAGLIFYGGYPELYAKQLSGNHAMREEIKRKVEGGTPCIAECGGFQYLQESIQDEKGFVYPMCSCLPGKSFHTPSLKRFGYLTLEGGLVFGKKVGTVRAHEFHYYDSECCGEEFLAKKPLSNRMWKCMISTDKMLAGYPHIHYAGNPEVAKAYMEACRWNYRQQNTWQSTQQKES